MFSYGFAYVACKLKNSCELLFNLLLILCSFLIQVFPHFFEISLGS